MRKPANLDLTNDAHHEWVLRQMRPAMFRLHVWADLFCIGMITVRWPSAL